MGDVVDFNRGHNEEPEHCCETCELVNEFIPYIRDCTDDKELFEVLTQLVRESQSIGLKHYLVNEVNSLTQLIDHLELGCCEE